VKTSIAFSSFITILPLVRCHVVSAVEAVQRTTYETINLVAFLADERQSTEERQYTVRHVINMVETQFLHGRFLLHQSQGSGQSANLQAPYRVGSRALGNAAAHASYIKTIERLARPQATCLPIGALRAWLACPPETMAWLSSGLTSKWNAPQQISVSV